MFVPYIKNTVWWFNPSSFEEPIKFELLGTLWGLAIYNSILLDIKLPRVVYKKLLKETLVLEDIRDIDPEMY